MIRNTVTLGAIAALNVAMGFAFIVYTVAALGPGRLTDAFFAGMVIPQLISAIGVASLGNVVTPILANQSEEIGRAHAWQLSAVVAGVCVALSLLLALLAPLWVPLTVPGFDAAGVGLTVELARIHLFATVFTAEATLLVAAQNARHRFLWAELSGPVAGALSFALLIWALPRWGVHGVAWAWVVKPVIQAALLLPQLGRYRAERSEPALLSTLWLRLKPLLLGSTYYRLDIVVDRVLVSLAPLGNLTLLYLAQQTYSSAATVLSRGVANPAMPVLANLARDGRWEDYRCDVRRRMWVALALTAAPLAIFSVAGEPALMNSLAGGRFSAQDASMLWLLLMALGGQWIGGGVGAVTTVAYYARGDTLTPTRLGVITFTLYLPLKVWAFFAWGTVGLAVTTSLFFLANAVLQVLLLNRGPHAHT